MKERKKERKKEKSRIERKRYVIECRRGNRGSYIMLIECRNFCSRVEITNKGKKVFFFLF